MHHRNREFKKWMVVALSFAICAALMTLNKRAQFHWPIGSASPTREYLAVILSDGTDFRERCRTNWKDECYLIVQNIPSWPNQLDKHTRVRLEKRLKSYLAQKELSGFKIEVRQLNVAQPL